VMDKIAIEESEIQKMASKAGIHLIGSSPNAALSSRLDGIQATVKKIQTEQQDDKAKTQSAVDLSREKVEAGVEKMAREAGMQQEAPHAALHSRLDGVEAKLKTEQKKAGDGNELAEKRKERDQADIANTKARQAEIANAKDKLEIDVGVEVQCSDRNNLDCFEKRSSEKYMKAKKDRYEAYDLARKAALLGSHNPTEGKQLQADWHAEQAKVVAAFMIGDAERARQDLDVLKNKNAANAKASKSLKKQVLDVQKVAEKKAGAEVKKEAYELEKQKSTKLIRNAVENANEEAKVIEDKIAAKEQIKVKATQKVEESGQEEAEKNKVDEAKKQTEGLEKKKIEEEENAVKKAEDEVENADASFLADASKTLKRDKDSEKVEGAENIKSAAVEKKIKPDEDEEEVETGDATLKTDTEKEKVAGAENMKAVAVEKKIEPDEDEEEKQ